MRIAILFGGQSSEHPVSLMSATSVVNNLDKKYEQYLVGITKDGRWYHYLGESSDIENGEWEHHGDNEEVILSANRNHHGFYNLKKQCIDKIDVIFPVLHGRYGEDGTIQGLCQLAGIKMISNSLANNAISMDKEFTHIICESYGIKMAKYLAVKKGDNYTFESLKDKLGLPMYVKPAREGSSFGAHKIKNKDDFIKYTNDAFNYDSKILYEEFIDGNEVGYAYLPSDDSAKVYEVIVDTEMYGYDEKYNGYKTNIYYPAKTLSQQQQDEVVEISKKIAKIMECDVLARIDFFASSKGLIFNELNTIPGFTSHSLYPAMFNAAGVNATELLNKLIDLVKD